MFRLWKGLQLPVQGQYLSRILKHDSRRKRTVCLFQLQQHMKYHRDERDFFCPLCPFSFHELKTLKNHLLKVHSIANPTELLHTCDYRTPSARHKTSALEQAPIQAKPRLRLPQPKRKPKQKVRALLCNQYPWISCFC